MRERALLALAIALIVYGSLYPWHFEAPAHGLSAPQVLLHSWPSQWNIFSLRDAALNVPLYAPVGLLAFLAIARRHPRWAAIAGGVGLSIALTVSMEMTQVYVPGRTPSLFDVLCNSLGGALGVLAAILVRPHWSRLTRRATGRLQVSAVFLLASWTGYQLFPFFPAVGRTHLRTLFHQLLHPGSVSVAGVWAGAAEWLLVAILLHRVLRPPVSSLLLLAIPVARCFVATRTVALEDALAFAIGMLLWVVLPERFRPRAALALLASGILLLELEPFQFSSQPAPFSWIPFAASLVSERGNGAIVMFRKTFEYGGLIWLLKNARLGYSSGSLFVAGALAVLEWLQRYLPGRSPEITDPLLALLAGLLLWACDFRFRRGLA